MPATEKDFETARDVVGFSNLLSLVPSIAKALADERERCLHQHFGFNVGVTLDERINQWLDHSKEVSAKTLREFLNAIGYEIAEKQDA